jgi:hypothetical protein
VFIAMPLLVFSGEGPTLKCTPPTEGYTKIALIYFSPKSQKLFLEGNFVEKSIINNTSRNILGMSDFTGPPIYLPLKPNIPTFELHALKSDLSQYKGKNMIAICHLI